ncbi:MAG: hypothetical protein N4A65_05450 [Cohaesibacter sp.]|jgi:hypothetical protein|nr:hypothetical protein [Cohaesibacter sp.]
MPLTHPLCLTTILGLSLFSLLATPTNAASTVTTERIITLPDYSTSSADAPATVTDNPHTSAESGTSINGIPRTTGPVVGAEGQITADEALEEQQDIAPAGAAVPHITPPKVIRDISDAPQPVQRMHAALLKAAQSGILEQLRLPIEMNEVPPIIGIEDGASDPIAIMQQMSGDVEGSEILAILSEILESGFILQDAGTPQEMYVWPYFADYPLHRLSAPQRVELFRLITSGDFAEMEGAGQYLFYRLGIGPDGTWHYFTAGD